MKTGETVKKISEDMKVIGSKVGEKAKITSASASKSLADTAAKMKESVPKITEKARTGSVSALSFMQKTTGDLMKASKEAMEKVRSHSVSGGSSGGYSSISSHDVRASSTSAPGVGVDTSLL